MNREKMKDCFITLPCKITYNPYMFVYKETTVHFLEHMVLIENLRIVHRYEEWNKRNIFKLRIL